MLKLTRFSPLQIVQTPNPCLLRINTLMRISTQCNCAIFAAGIIVSSQGRLT